MKQTQINLYSFDELKQEVKEQVLENYRHLESDRWKPTSKEYDFDYLYDTFVRLTDEWEALTGINAFVGSIFYNTDTGVKFFAQVEDINKLVNYYAMQGRRQAEQVKNLKKLSYFRTVTKELSIVVDYDIYAEDQTPRTDILKSGWYSAPTATVTDNKTRQELADKLKDIALYVAKQIADDIHQFLIDLKEEQESDEYLIEMFKTYKISFLSNGYLYNGY